MLGSKQFEVAEMVFARRKLCPISSLRREWTVRARASRSAALLYFLH